MKTISPRTEEILEAVGLGHLVFPMRAAVTCGFVPTIEFAEELQPLIIEAYQFIGPVPELRAFMRMCRSAKRHSEAPEPGSLSDLIDRFNSDDDTLFEG